MPVCAARLCFDSSLFRQIQQYSANSRVIDLGLATLTIKRCSMLLPTSRAVKVGKFGIVEANLGEGGQNLVETGFCSDISALSGARATCYRRLLTRKRVHERESVNLSGKFEPSEGLWRFPEISSAGNLQVPKFSPCSALDPFDQASFDAQ